MSDVTEAIKFEDDLILTFDGYHRLAVDNDPAIQKLRMASILMLDQDGKIIEEDTDPITRLKKKAQLEKKIRSEIKKKKDISDRERIQKIMAKLDEYKKNNPPEPPTLEQMIEESRQSYSEINMFDYGRGKMSNEQAMADFYGWAIVRQIREEIEYSYDHKLDDQKPGQISKKLWQRMKDIRAGKLPKAKPIKYENKCKPDQKKPELLVDKKPKATKPKEKKKCTIKVEQRQRQKGDDFFLMLERGVIRNETYRKIFKGPSVVYEWLWANIVRNQWVDNKTYPIKEKYFSKGYLAYCSTYGKIAKDCGMSKNTVHRYIKDFNEAGIVKLEPYVPEGKKQGQTVFILGAWEKVDGEIIETYYRDKIFITPKSIKN